MVKTAKQLKAEVEKQRLQLELTLLESQTVSWGNYVNPNGAHTDPITGEEWSEIGADNEEGLPYVSEQGLATIRKRARHTVRSNSYAENLIVNLVAFVIGSGHTYRCQPLKSVEDEEKARKLSAQVQEWLDLFLKKNRWKKRQKEVYRRQHVDGECFIRIFKMDNGNTKIRFIEPWEVSTPRELLTDVNSSYGIKTDEDDVETIEEYYINEDEIPAEEVQHRKLNVTMNSKRGLSSIYCVQDNLDRGKTLLKNMSTVVAMQAAIGMIRKHDTTAQGLQNFVQDYASKTVTDPDTGQTVRGKKFGPASIIDTNKDTEYEFPSVGLNAAAPATVLSAELRSVSSSKALAEYMVGADASRLPYANSMVAESPAVRYFESEQADQIEADLELIWVCIDHAVNVGSLPEDLRKFITIQVTPPQLVTREPETIAKTNDVYLNQRIKSPQTVRQELGLDSEQEDKNWEEYDSIALDSTPSLPIPVTKE